MKNTFVAYLNFLLIGVLIVLAGLWTVALFQKREFDKVYWGADIRSQSSLANLTDGSKNNMLKILDASFYNRYDNSQQGIHNDVRNFILYSGDQDSIYFWSDRQLLPDSLSLRYFSIDESQFYALNAVLPYKKIKTDLKDNTSESPENNHLVVAIEERGKIVLQRQNASGKRFTITTLQATPTNGTAKELTREKSLEGYYDSYDGIHDIAGFVAIMKSQYKWKLDVQIRDGEQLFEAYMMPFNATGNFDLMDENTAVSLRNIPNVIYLKWGKDKAQYGDQYYFEPGSILDVFQKLDALPGNEPIILSVDLNTKDDFIHFFASKGTTKFALRDLYPDKVIHYAN